MTLTERSTDGVCGGVFHASAAIVNFFVEKREIQEDGAGVVAVRSAHLADPAASPQLAETGARHGPTERRPLQDPLAVQVSSM